MHFEPAVAPDLSVIVATCRRPRLLGEALRSVLAQEAVSLEVIVADDDPAGSARTVVELLGDPRLRYVRPPRPSGGYPGAVRNLAFALAACPYVQFFDDDDLLVPGAYRALIDVLSRDPQAGAAFGRIEPFGDLERLSGERVYFHRAARRALHIERTGWRALMLAELLYGNAPLVCSGVLFRRGAVEAAGGFDPSLRRCEDLDLVLRVARVTSVRFVDRPVLQYRVTPGSLAHAPDGTPFSEVYRRIYDKYRTRYGAFELGALQLLARTALRLA